MKHFIYFTLVLFAAFSCQKQGAKDVANPNIFPKTSWKSAKENKFPLYYQFIDSATLMIRDDIGEIANTYKAIYKMAGDTIKIEVMSDVRDSGVMNGYKQSLVYKDSVLLLVSDKMLKDSATIFYTTPDKFIKE